MKELLKLLTLYSCFADVATLRINPEEVTTATAFARRISFKKCPSRMFPQLTHLQTIDCVPPDIFVDLQCFKLHVQTLRISNAAISCISGALEIIPANRGHNDQEQSDWSSLQELSMYHSGLSSASFDSIHNSSGVVHLHPLSLTPNLVRLKLRNNNIDSLGPLFRELAVYCPLLREVDVSQNCITVFPEVDLPLGVAPLQLLKLDVRMNKIKTLSEIVRSPLNLELLRELDLSHNVITDIGELGVLGNLKNLQKLTLEENPLQRHPKYRHYVLHATRGRLYLQPSDGVLGDVVKHIQPLSLLDGVAVTDAELARHNSIRPPSRQHTAGNATVQSPKEFRRIWTDPCIQRQVVCSFSPSGSRSTKMKSSRSRRRRLISRRYVRGGQVDYRKDPAKLLQTVNSPRNKASANSYSTSDAKTHVWQHRTVEEHEWTDYSPLHCSQLSRAMQLKKTEVKLEAGGKAWLVDLLKYEQRPMPTPAVPQYRLVRCKTEQQQQQKQEYKSFKGCRAGKGYGATELETDDHALSRGAVSLPQAQRECAMDSACSGFVFGPGLSEWPREGKGLGYYWKLKDMVPDKFRQYTPYTTHVKTQVAGDKKLHEQLEHDVEWLNQTLASTQSTHGDEWLSHIDAVLFIPIPPAPKIPVPVPKARAKSTMAVSRSRDKKTRSLAGRVLRSKKIERSKTMPSNANVKSPGRTGRRASLQCSPRGKSRLPPALPERGKEAALFDFQLIEELVEIKVTLQGMYKRKLLLKVVSIRVSISCVWLFACLAEKNSFWGACAMCCA